MSPRPVTTALAGKEILIKFELHDQPTLFEEAAIRPTRIMVGRQGPPKLCPSHIK